MERQGSLLVAEEVGVFLLVLVVEEVVVVEHLLVLVEGVVAVVVHHQLQRVVVAVEVGPYPHLGPEVVRELRERVVVQRQYRRSRHCRSHDHFHHYDHLQLLISPSSRRS